MVVIEGSAQSPPDPEPVPHVVHEIGPWLALAGLIVAGFIIVSGFQVSLRNAPKAPRASGASTATSSVDASGSASVTGTVAVPRVDGIWMRTNADMGSLALVAVKKGVELQVLNRTDTWLRVKDQAGHIGWISNSSQSVEIRKK
jgi:hypothetical protein